MLNLVLILPFLVSLGGAGEASLIIHDESARFKQFFRIENSGVHWTLEVDTKELGVDFITFFATDIDRYFVCSLATGA